MFLLVVLLLTAPPIVTTPTFFFSLMMLPLANFFQRPSRRTTFGSTSASYLTPAPTAAGGSAPRPTWRTIARRTCPRRPGASPAESATRPSRASVGSRCTWPMSTAGPAPETAPSVARGPSRTGTCCRCTWQRRTRTKENNRRSMPLTCPKVSRVKVPFFESLFKKEKSCVVPHIPDTIRILPYVNKNIFCPIAFHHTYVLLVILFGLIFCLVLLANGVSFTSRS